MQHNFIFRNKELYMQPSNVIFGLTVCVVVLCVCLSLSVCQSVCLSVFLCFTLLWLLELNLSIQHPSQLVMTVFICLCVLWMCSSCELLSSSRVHLTQRQLYFTDLQMHTNTCTWWTHTHTCPCWMHTHIHTRAHTGCMQVVGMGGGEAGAHTHTYTRACDIHNTHHTCTGTHDTDTYCNTHGTHSILHVAYFWFSHLWLIMLSQAVYITLLINVTRLVAVNWIKSGV